MGGLLAKPLNESFQKQQEFMLHSQQLQLERTMQMQNLMREKQVAIHIADARDRLHFFSALIAVVIPVSFIGFKRTNNRAVFVPLFPLSFMSVYLYDMGYGNKMNRIIRDSESICQTYSDKLRLPKGIPTFNEIESRRLLAQSEELMDN